MNAVYLFKEWLQRFFTMLPCHHCTTLFIKAWTQVLLRFRFCTRRVGDSRWWWSLRVVPAGNKAKRLSLVNHTTKTIHDHHHHHHHHYHHIRNISCCPHVETGQLICCANQLTGFYMRATLAFNGFIIPRMCLVPLTEWVNKW